MKWIAIIDLGLWTCLALAAGLLAGCNQPSAPPPPPPDTRSIPAPFDAGQALARYQPVELEFDARLLSPEELKTVHLLIQACRQVDEIFWRQVYSRNIELRNTLAGRSDPTSKPLYEYFLINYGPFDRLNHDAPFFGTAHKPLGANFYPEDLGRPEFEAWIQQHPDQAALFKSNFSVIRRQPGGLVAIPYSREYREFLAPAAEALRQAARATRNASLRKYLELRARDLLGNDYFESDLAWMDLEGTPIEGVIGPYEVYEDKLFGYKAAFEAQVAIRDPQASRQLSLYAKHLPDLEKQLPVPERYRAHPRGASSPISVVDQIFSAGDLHAGVQTSAFNLPNDERVRQAKGSKKVMLKNIMAAKFKACLRPIAERVLEADQLPLVVFQPFFDHVLSHELSHGMGPGKLVIEGRETTVSAELKDLYPAIEEAKADTLGLWVQLRLMDQKIIPENRPELLATYLAGIFRSVRFGISEAHGLGTMMQYNYLKRMGAIRFDLKTGRYAVVPDRVAPAVESLAREILLIEATADYDSARAFVRVNGAMAPEVRITLETLADIPTDIRPIFPVLPESR